MFIACALGISDLDLSFHLREKAVFAKELGQDQRGATYKRLN